MKLISVNVGRPRDYEWQGRTIRTSIWKHPITGRVPVVHDNVSGDEQADLSVHGGANKAVYAYPSEHYAFWRGVLTGVDLPWGSFGENLSTEGLDETGVRIGDLFRIGSLHLRVTQPRMPCYKLGFRFQRADLVDRFLDSGRSGIYFAIVREGEIGAGDEIELLERSGDTRTIADDFELRASKRRSA